MSRILQLLTSIISSCALHILLLCHYCTCFSNAFMIPAPAPTSSFTFKALSSSSSSPTMLHLGLSRNEKYKALLSLGSYNIMHHDRFTNRRADVDYYFSSSSSSLGYQTRSTSSSSSTTTAISPNTDIASSSSLFRKRTERSFIMLKGAISPNNNGNNDQLQEEGKKKYTNFFYRILVRFKNVSTWFFQLLKNINIFKGSSTEPTTTATTATTTATETTMINNNVSIMDQVEETSKKVEAINSKITDAAELGIHETNYEVKEIMEEEEEIRWPIKVDTSIPYDAAAKLAYEASDKSMLYSDFKMKYEADCVADVIAKKQAEVVVIHPKVVEEVGVVEVVEEEKISTATTATGTPTVVSSNTLPKGNHWAVSAPDVDLSAVWKIVVDDKFKEEYDNYLKNLGQPALVRSIAVNIVELTTEEVVQGDEGRTLSIKGKNLRGVWERTLLSSGADYDAGFDEKEDEHDKIDIITADKETVKAEAWWEKDGTVHRSYLRGVKKYGGGDFESRRYLKDDGNTLICESVFHPTSAEGKDPAVIKWTFTRV